jgi:5S rRNA maturation endonuclease (ribonuclease M5)
MSDLFPDDVDTSPQGESTSWNPFGDEAKKVATYDYIGESGEVRFQVVRCELIDPTHPAYPAKEFRQRVPGKGWGRTKFGVNPILYRLPRVLEAAAEGRVVFVVEGEKDVHTLEEMGFTATCNPQGAGDWQNSYSEALRCARVAILPDNDVEGKKHALTIARSVYPVAHSVRVVELPELKRKGDVTDWVESGGTRDELKQLIKETAPLTAPPVAANDEDSMQQGDATDTSGRPDIGVRVSDVERREVRWLWPGRLALGEMTILDGDPGLGKSTILCDVAARLTRGRAFPGEESAFDAEEGGGGGVVFVTTEDSVAHTIRPRLEAAGACLKRCKVVATVPTAGGSERVPVLPDDLDLLGFAVGDVEARLLVIDPLMAHLGNTNAHKDQDVRSALAPLSTFAEEQGLAVVVVRHLNKMSGGSPLYRGGGSIGIIGAVRIGLLVGRAPQDESEIIIASTKNNLAPMPESLTLQLEESEAIPGIARVVWNGASTLRASDLLGSMASRSSPALDEAKGFLRDVLKDGPRRSTEVYELMESEGIAKKTLKRAKKELGIESERLDPEDRCWYFVPPDTWTSCSNQGGHTDQGGQTAESAGPLDSVAPNPLPTLQNGDSAPTSRETSGQGGQGKEFDPLDPHAGSKASASPQPLVGNEISQDDKSVAASEETEVIWR